MPDLSVTIAGVPFKNPVIAASGTFGFGREYAQLFPLSTLGGIALKGLTLEPREGNPPPRCIETPQGMLNCVGLQNPGVTAFLRDDLPWLRTQGTVLICNIAGSTREDYCRMAELLSEAPVDMLELNISCPNVREGGMAFGTSCESVGAVTRAVRRRCKKPLIVKLSPNVGDIASIAEAAESAGADALSLINTLTGMRIDLRTRRPMLSNNTGGLSGPAVLPVAIRMVWQAAARVKIPVIGIGGISRWQDAVEMLLAGASAVQVGTATFSDPFAMQKIIAGIESYMSENNIQNIFEITGSVKPYESI
ncbi:MAG: dihydroorotate dehydrogenase [Clostridia bacterium]|nr:dihydroorotate dehydrogenase [Clostridia bacterium]